MSEQTTLFHGSLSVIEKPSFGVGNPFNDYGLGFYCTMDEELAKEWACSETTDGYANRYTLDKTGLRTMSLESGEYNILNWLALLLDNRRFRISNDVAGSAKAYLLSKFLPNVHDIDVITGYRANDSYFAFASAFINSVLSLAQLEEAMYLGKLGGQTVLISEKAFSQISFERYEVADHKIYYPRKMARDQEARSIFRQQRFISQAKDAVYIMDIMRGDWENDDPRLRRDLS
ncbi:MAG: DUF3990 domain-containing protein [Clostridiales Family XIII bacterium]|jgi:hypothetical protein|nr:DUF3990 domain-containing protein [Clostridiales Family XIII bacterium]